MGSPAHWKPMIGGGHCMDANSELPSYILNESLDMKDCWEHCAKETQCIAYAIKGPKWCANYFEVENVRPSAPGWSSHWRTGPFNGKVVQARWGSGITCYLKVNYCKNLKDRKACNSKTICQWSKGKPGKKASCRN